MQETAFVQTKHSSGFYFLLRKFIHFHYQLQHCTKNIDTVKVKEEVTLCAMKRDLIIFTCK